MDKGKKVFLVLMIVFAAASVALGAWTWVLYRDSSQKNDELEARYQHAYFELLQQTNDMEIKLRKLLVSTSDAAQTKLLYDVWKGSEVCGSALATLSARDSSVAEAIKFENQLGDYSYWWAHRLEGGEGLDDEAYDSFQKLHSVLVKLGTELGKVQTEIAGGYLFMKDFGGENDVLSVTLGNLNGGSVEYPKLIYDGPFSDSRQNVSPKGNLGQKIDADEGKTLAEKYLSSHNVSEVEYIALWQGDLPTHAYRAALSDGTEITVQLTEEGGKLYALTMPAETDEPNLSEEECAVIAARYLSEADFLNMGQVWISNSNSIVYVNFAPTENGVVLYSDLVKVKVRSDNGLIVGVEANNYLFNHVSRGIDLTGIISQSDAAASVSARIQTEGEGRLCLIPDGASERLCYEFVGDYDGRYYVYIDAKTGEEAEILFVIDSDGGKLLM